MCLARRYEQYARVLSRTSSNGWPSAAPVRPRAPARARSSAKPFSSCWHEKAQFLLHVDERMTLLEREDERLARVFECRYFAGLTTAETAEAIGASVRTAR